MKKHIAGLVAGALSIAGLLGAAEPLMHLRGVLNGVPVEIGGTAGQQLDER